MIRAAWDINRKLEVKTVMDESLYYFVMPSIFQQILGTL